MRKQSVMICPITGLFNSGESTPEVDRKFMSFKPKRSDIFIVHCVLQRPL